MTIEHNTIANGYAPFRNLNVAHSTLPSFPVNALSPELHDMVLAVAAHTQTAPDMAASFGLGILAACLQGKYIVGVPSGYTEPVNLYVAVVAKPGERKSAVMHLMASPLHEFEQQMNCALSDGGPSSVDGVQEQPPRLTADDCTPEALARLLSENCGKLTVISAEGGIFDILAGCYSRKPNIDIWLKGHCGDPIRVDRIGREPAYIPQPTLSAILAVQPSVLSEIMDNTTMTGRGLVARFLFSLPPSNLGHRTFLAPGIPADVQEKYTASISRMLSIAHSAPCTLHLSDAAIALVSTHFLEHEHYITGPGQYMADWAGKYIGSVLRIAGLLHAAEFSNDCYISSNTMQRAIEIGRYYLAHAAYAYTTMDGDPSITKALFAWSKLIQFSPAEVKRSDLFQVCRGKYFKKVDELSSALELLESHGYIRTYSPPYNGHGRPPDMRIVPNPLVQH